MREEGEGEIRGDYIPISPLAPRDFFAAGR